MLVDPKLFDEMMLPLQGKLVGYVRQQGNVGDALKEEGTSQLFERYGVKRYPEPLGFEFGAQPGQDLKNWKAVRGDELVFSAGGTMGKKDRLAFHQRERALETDKKLTIFPQSFSAK